MNRCNHKSKGERSPQARPFHGQDRVPPANLIWHAADTHTPLEMTDEVMERPLQQDKGVKEGTTGPPDVHKLGSYTLSQQLAVPLYQGPWP